MASKEVKMTKNKVERSIDDGELHEFVLADPRDIVMPHCPSEVGQRARAGDVDMVVERVDMERGVIWFRKAK
jgi:hypothetical protein